VSAILHKNYFLSNEKYGSERLCVRDRRCSPTVTLKFSGNEVEQKERMAYFFNGV